MWRKLDVRAASRGPQIRPVSRRRTSIAWTVVAAMALTGMSTTPASAVEADPEAALVVEGLLQFGVAFGGTSALESLATPLPLTDVAIRDVLTLDRLLAQRIGDAVRGQTTTLDNLDDVVSGGDGLTFTDAVPPLDAPVGSREWVLDVDITQDLPLPLAYADDQLVFGAAAVDGELAARLDGAFRIRFDPTADPLLQFQLVGEQLLAITTWTRPTDSDDTDASKSTVPAFTAVDGFIDVAVDGTALVDVALSLRMRDPNGRGVINREDLEFGIAEDLYTMAPPAAEAVTIDLDLTSGLLGGGPHGAVVAEDRDAAAEGPWAAAVVTRDAALARLSSVTAGQAMGAFASYAGALLGVESAIDADLPLLDGRLTDLHAPAATLVEVITEQATASILCGAADTIPPSGAPRPGQSRYCQAITQSAVADADSVVWSALDGAATITPPSGPTVGPAPSANVRVDSTGGDPHLIVTFDEAGEQRRARSTIGSVQTLGTVLGSVGLGGAVTYDSTSRALEVAIASPLSDVTLDMATGDAPALAPLTGLSGLCGATSATGVRACPQPDPDDPGGPDLGSSLRNTVKVEAKDLAFTATLGIGLLPDGAALDVVPEVYIRPGAEDVLWAIGGLQAALTEPTPLVARIGFLQVDVDLNSLMVDTDPELPAAAVAIATADIMLHGDSSRAVSGVVRVGDLLAGAAVVVDPTILDDGPDVLDDEIIALPVPAITRGVTVAAELVVKDAPTDANARLLNVEGRVTASWPNIDPLFTPVVTTTPAYEDLRLFDVVPTLRATVTAVDDTGTLTMLTADSLDLVRDLGVAPADFGTENARVDRRVRRAGDAAGCGSLTVLSATSLRCDDPIDPDQVWAVGDVLSTDGDPDALRDRLLDDLAALVNVFETSGPDTGGDATFPLLDLRPEQISAARRGVGVGVGSLYQAVAQAPGSPEAVAASTLQRFPAALGGLIGTPTVPALTFSTPGGVPQLELDLQHSAAEPFVVAPLRISEGARLLRVTTDVTGELDDVKVSIQSDSSARLRIALDLAAGTTSVHSDTQVVERVNGLTDAPAVIREASAEYGGADYTVGEAADIDLAIGVQQVTSLPSTAADWTPLADVRAAVVATRSGIGAASTCAIAGAPTDAAACAVVPLASTDDSRVVSVALRADESSGGAGGALPGDLPLAVRFLGDGLVFLGTTLTQGLDGNLNEIQLPLVGADLDAGADVPDQVIAFAQAVREGLPATVDNDDDHDDFAAVVTAAVRAAAVESGLKLQLDAKAMLACAGPCPTDATVADVQTVEFPLELSPATPTTAAVPFQSGLPGVELHSTELVPATVEDWTLTATIGIRRGTGPFVRFEADGQDNVEILSVTSSAQLSDADDLKDLGEEVQDCHGWDRAPAGLDVPADDDSARCIDAVVGFLPSVLVDLGETGYDATVTVAVEPATAGVDHYLPGLVDGLPVVTTADGTGALDMYFEGWAGELGFVDVLGGISIEWLNGEFTGDLEFSDLYLDSNTVNAALGPVFESIRTLIGVYQPIFDVLGAPVPVVSDLSKKLGGPDITMISLIVAGAVARDARARKKTVDKTPGSGRDKVARHEFGSAIKLYGLAVGLGSLIEQLSGAPEGLIALGGDEANPTGGLLTVYSAYFKKDRCGPVQLNATSGLRQVGLDVTAGRCLEPSSSRRNFKPVAGSNVRAGQSKKSTQSSFSLPGLDIPILTDPRVSYDLILGRRTTRLVQVEIGTFGVEVGLEKSYGPFAIGPVPVFAQIGGSVGIEGTLSLGFDTDALTTLIRTNERGDVAALETAAVGTNDLLARGFYVDDLDSSGRDVPEISFVASFYVGASVSVGIATAGIRGGVEINFLFDANDPDGDGRIRVREFEAYGIECAYRASAVLTFFLDFFLTLELLVKTENTSWRLYESPPFKLWDKPCDPQTPKLATLDRSGERDVLTLTSGKNYVERSAYLSDNGDDDDRYTVRQLSLPNKDDKVILEVSAFQLTQTYTVSSNAIVVADGGGGNDQFRFFPGSLVTTSADGAVSVTTVPFQLDTQVDGGAGADVVEGGDGADVVDGGDHADTISGGLGDDVLTGGPGADVLEAGPGQDRADGGPGADTITMGAGADIAFGGDGNDRISGGPGVDPTALFPTIDPLLIAPQLDSGDLLVGEAGQDIIDGAYGSDIVVGGTYGPDLGDKERVLVGEGVPVLPLIVTTARDGIAGVAVDGQLLTTIQVTLPTVELPTEAAIRAECAIEEPAESVVLLADEVSGGDERDYLVGGPGPDVIQGGAGPDLICGRSGDDMLVGEGGDVTPDESGDDEMLGGSGQDRMFGGPGGDTMDGGDGDDLVRGGVGDDVLAGGSGADLVLGDGGADTLTGDGANPAGSVQGDGRNIRCDLWTTVINGFIDLNGDLVGNDVDDGQLDGLRVVDGRVLGADGNGFSGVLGQAIFVDGLADIDGSGTGGIGDNAVLDLPRMTGAVGDGDCLLGGDDADVLLDGGFGGDRVNAGAGDDVAVFGGAGHDLVRGGPGDDRVHGGSGADLVIGDSGDDLVEGNAGDDRIRGGAGDDVLVGGSAIADAIDGADVLLGDRGTDVLAGGNAIFVRATDGPTSPVPTGTLTLLATPAGPQLAGWDDQLFGGFDDDWAYGQEGDDLVRGGQDDDVVEGGPGADRVQGDDGDDLVVGGSSTGIGLAVGSSSGDGMSDGADRLFGDAGIDDADGDDVLVGDNADLRVVLHSTRDRWPDHRPDVAITLFDLAIDSPVAGQFGADVMDGGGGDDLLLGQSGDDVMTGNGGNDALEGNAGSDELFGDWSGTPRGAAGDDALVGGSWTAHAYDASEPDAGDVLSGDGGSDILLGDNGTVLATVTLLDVPGVGTDGAPGTTAGDDHLFGGSGTDVMFGQSGNDLLDGGAEIDALEGGPGEDRVKGGGGDDTLVGGSSAADGHIVEGRSGAGLPDAGDILEGGDGDDVIAGDNARLITRSATRADGTLHRDVTLFDVALLEAPALVGTSGDDVVYGNAGRDLLFGQGGEDLLHGGDDDDVVEGNAGDDVVAGDGGADDLLGGGSAADGIVISSLATAPPFDAGDRLLTAATGDIAEIAAGQLDGDDILWGGSIPGDADGLQLDGDDVLLGDNGRIIRTGTGHGTAVLTAPAGATWSTRVVRQVLMADTTADATSGSDVLYGQAGDDDLYGQLDGTARGDFAPVTLDEVPVLGDLLDGGPGEDALVGDLGIVTPTLASELGAQTTLRTRGDFVLEQVRTTGSLVRMVELVAIAIGGEDVLLGGSGRDHLHGGAGDDDANGGEGDDAVFGADGDDDLWGGPGHDRIYGGYGQDNLDVKPRPNDPALWAVVASTDDTDDNRATINGEDLLYGGFGADALQADVGESGPSAGDRLLDWVGAYNVYYVCSSAYGAGRIQRRPDPKTLAVLVELAAADGALTPGTGGTSGWTELGLVTTKDNKQNNSPKHPDHPGGETCEGTP
jgi:Ca2+-binding RTX toxin-like protein